MSTILKPIYTKTYFQVMSGKNLEFSRPLQALILYPKSGHTTKLVENTKIKFFQKWAYNANGHTNL